jgi:hypothetical protein
LRPFFTSPSLKLTWSLIPCTGASEVIGCIWIIHHAVACYYARKIVINDYFT